MLTNGKRNKISHYRIMFLRFQSLESSNFYLDDVRTLLFNVLRTLNRSVRREGERDREVYSNCSPKLFKIETFEQIFEENVTQIETDLLFLKEHGLTKCTKVPYYLRKLVPVSLILVFL